MNSFREIREEYTAYVRSGSCIDNVSDGNFDI